MLCENIKVKNLSFSYNKDELILKDINLDVIDGEFVCILGQSGCGKSTLLRLLAGLETPTSGEILIGDEKINGTSLSRGVVFQDYGLFPWFSAGENILLALKQKYPKQDKKILKDIVLDAMERVGLEKSIYNKWPKELSGGMKQRCAIAQALSIEPKILLMDEPFGALDAVTRAKLQDLLLTLYKSQEKKKTVFFVTHDVDEAMLLGSKIILLGQSPSSIIYSYTIKEGENPTRENQFENVNTLKVRTELIKQMNKNISKHML